LNLAPKKSSSVTPENIQTFHCHLDGCTLLVFHYRACIDFKKNLFGSDKLGFFFARHREVPYISKLHLKQRKHGENDRQVESFRTKSMLQVRTFW
jgi:hypothetical protein